jgi:hypothetical protein
LASFGAGCWQGDQIGRISASRAIVYFGQFLENDKTTPNFSATFSHAESYGQLMFGLRFW